MSKLQSSSGARSLDKREGLFVNPLSVANLDEPLPRATWVLYLLIATVAVAITWACFAQVDEVTRSEGRIVPDGKEQIIASLESGVLAELFVKEGQEVEAGQALARLDPTRFEAQENEGQVKRLSLQVAIARLTAEANGRALKFPNELVAQPAAKALIDNETDVYESRQRVLVEAVASLDRSIGLTNKELRMSQDMAKQGLMSDVEVMRLVRAVNELQQQRSERISRARQEASAELARNQNELAMLDEQMVVRKDVLTRTLLRSPVHGLVKNIRSNTVGGVITTGAPLMEIVPLGSKVLIEAKIKPKDIGFVRVGQTAEIKLNGYDYNVNGGLEGKIEYISPDSLGDVERGADSGYYRALIRSEKSTLRDKGKPLPVIPGMSATVDIRTGARSVMSYLLRPMMKSREALQER